MLREKQQWDQLTFIKNHSQNNINPVWRADLPRQNHLIKDPSFNFVSLVIEFSMHAFWGIQIIGRVIHNWEGNLLQRVYQFKCLVRHWWFSGRILARQFKCLYHQKFLKQKPRLMLLIGYLVAQSRWYIKLTFIDQHLSPQHLLTPETGFSSFFSFCLPQQKYSAFQRQVQPKGRSPTPPPSVLDQAQRLSFGLRCHNILLKKDVLVSYP